MSIVKINVIEVPEGRGEVLEQRFAARAGEVETVDGFESFDLLRPTAGTDRYLVVTKWRDEASFQAWMNSESFQRGHAQGRPAASGAPAEGHPQAEGHPRGQGQPEPAAHGDTDAAPADAHGQGHPQAQAQGQPGGEAGSPQPAAVGSELWGFEVVTSASGQRP